MRIANYEKKPFIEVTGTIHTGWKAITQLVKQTITKDQFILVLDCYTGVLPDELKRNTSNLNPNVFIDTADLMKNEAEIIQMTAPFMTDDVLFGYLSNLKMSDFFDQKKLTEVQQKIKQSKGLVIVMGYGAALVEPHPDLLIYVDMARWEIIQRFRRREAKALGVDSRQDPISIQHKRAYFIDWKVCDYHKCELYNKIDYFLDTHIPENPNMIDRKTFMDGMNQAVTSPFRVVPFFDPAPWGGQWMKETFELEKEKQNYGWCFDCVPEENSLFFKVQGTLFEMPSVNLVYLKSRDLLGEPVEARFGKEFPIRFDFLDTMNGGNLSLQVHPTTEYIQKHFGIHYTQDESYYLFDAADDASVYLGVKKDIDKDAMIRDLKAAEKNTITFDAEKYVNKFPAKKHDHYLIPGGTIHCSGSNALVLEISSTPNLFTFKLWDWKRLGLDGKPRPINIDHGKNVIDWERDTDYAKKHLVNAVTVVAEGDGWVEEKTGLHPNEFIETRRHWFEKKVKHTTGNSVNVLNLVEGEEVVVESPTYTFKPYIVHYAETFIIPASIGDYTITPCGKSAGKRCGTIKAYVRL